jgi:DNA adenine methylase
MSTALDLFGQPLIAPTINAPLKWAGGKRWQVPYLEPFWVADAHRRLVEPFCGGLSVALGLAPDRALLNDANPHVINFYRHVQRGLVVDQEMANNETVFYRHRDRFNALALNGGRDSAEAANLFYYLNRTCFNGLCRFNRSGAFNVPFGTYKTITYARDFADYRDVFRAWTFTSMDFANVPLDASDFLYLDPPYDVDFTAYEPSWRGWPDQVRVAEWAANHPGPVLLSNQATDRIVALYTRLGFDLQFLDAPRRIACTGDRTPAREVLATRNLRGVA